MSSSLRSRKLLLGVTGSISAYKAAEIVRQLKKCGAEVQVIMTPDATRFIPALTLSTLSGKEALIHVFPKKAEGAWTQHVELGLWADLFIVAPATAQTLAKLAHGFCDNMLTAVALSARCPLLLCPAMDHDMYIHPATQANLQKLQQYGYALMPPEHGELASGLIGTGRLPDPADIVTRIAEEIEKKEALSAVSSEESFKGKKILVTAGPTQESLDPVRFLSNHSTGTMGFELAAAAQKKGGDVILICGPTDLQTPTGVHRVDVTSAAEMAAAVEEYGDADIVIMAAAVADYTPAHTSSSKIKKTGDNLKIELRRTKDILADLGANKRPGQILVGFALETNNLKENALRKLNKKNLDWIVLNSPNDAGAGFGTSTNKVTMFGAHGDEQAFPLMPKRDVAIAILNQIESFHKS